MQAIKFPVPNRSEYIPSPYEPDADGVLDIGYYKGSIIGGRPYVLECWQMDELVVATVFFSDEGLDAYSREDLVLLLELEDIIKFIGGKRLFHICYHLPVNRRVVTVLRNMRHHGDIVHPGVRSVIYSIFNWYKEYKSKK